MGKKYDPPYDIEILDELSTRGILHVFRSKETKNVYSDFFSTSFKCLRIIGITSVISVIPQYVHLSFDEFKQSWLASLSILKCGLNK